MKKLICILLAVLMCAFAGCSNEEPQETEPEIINTFALEAEQITAENVSPYDGLYLEYGDEELVSGLYAMKFTNDSAETIRVGQLIFTDGTQ